jgi:hypothetical protein
MLAPRVRRRPFSPEQRMREANAAHLRKKRKVELLDGLTVIDVLTRLPARRFLLSGMLSSPLGLRKKVSLGETLRASTGH